MMKRWLVIVLLLVLIVPLANAQDADPDAAFPRTEIYTSDLMTMHYPAGWATYHEALTDPISEAVAFGTDADLLKECICDLQLSPGQGSITISHQEIYGVLPDDFIQQLYDGFVADLGQSYEVTSLIPDEIDYIEIADQPVSISQLALDDEMRFTLYVIDRVEVDGMPFFVMVHLFALPDDIEQFEATAVAMIEELLQNDAPDAAAFPVEPVGDLDLAAVPPLPLPLTYEGDMITMNYPEGWTLETTVEPGLLEILTLMLDETASGDLSSGWINVFAMPGNINAPLSSSSEGQMIEVAGHEVVMEYIVLDDSEDGTISYLVEWVDPAGEMYLINVQVNALPDDLSTVNATALAMLKSILVGAAE